VVEQEPEPEPVKEPEPKPIEEEAADNSTASDNTTSEDTGEAASDAAHVSEVKKPEAVADIPPKSDDTGSKTD